jgi:hypothetical protein
MSLDELNSETAPVYDSSQDYTYEEPIDPVVADTDNLPVNEEVVEYNSLESVDSIETDESFLVNDDSTVDVSVTDIEVTVEESNGLGYEVVDDPELAALKSLEQGYTELIVVIIIAILIVGGAVFLLLKRRNTAPSAEEVPTSDPDEENATGHEEATGDESEGAALTAGAEKYDTATTENDA